MNLSYGANFRDKIKSLSINRNISKDSNGRSISPRASALTPETPAKERESIESPKYVMKLECNNLFSENTGSSKDLRVLDQDDLDKVKEASSENISFRYSTNQTPEPTKEKDQ